MGITPIPLTIGLPAESFIWPGGRYTLDDDAASPSAGVGGIALLPPTGTLGEG